MTEAELAELRWRMRADARDHVLSVAAELIALRLKDAPKFLQAMGQQVTGSTDRVAIPHADPALSNLLVDEYREALEEAWESFEAQVLAFATKR